MIKNRSEILEYLESLINLQIEKKTYRKARILVLQPGPCPTLTRTSGSQKSYWYFLHKLNDVKQLSIKGKTMNCEQLRNVKRRL